MNILVGLFIFVSILKCIELSLRHLGEPQVVADPQAHAEAARGGHGRRRPQFLSRLRPVGLAQPELSRDLHVEEVRLRVNKSIRNLLNG